MNEALQTIVLWGAVGGAIAFGLRYLWKGFRIIERLYALVDHELKPNSGSSMYDKITRLDKGFTDHLAESQADHQKLGEHDLTLVDHDGRLVALVLVQGQHSERLRHLEEFLAGQGFVIRQGRS